jgi:hypothetical protein
MLGGFETEDEHAVTTKRSKRTLKRWTQEPDGLPYTMMGRTRLYKPEWTAQWLEQRKRQNNPSQQPRRGRPRRQPERAGASP